jgi:hypothetical protein
MIVHFMHIDLRHGQGVTSFMQIILTVVTNQGRLVYDRTWGDGVGIIFGCRFIPYSSNWMCPPGPTQNGDSTLTLHSLDTDLNHKLVFCITKIVICILLHSLLPIFLAKARIQLHSSLRSRVSKTIYSEIM